MDNSPLFKPFEKLRRVQFPRRPPLKECLALSMTHLLLLFLQGGHRSSTSREHAGSGKLLGI